MTPRRAPRAVALFVAGTGLATLAVSACNEETFAPAVEPLPVILRSSTPPDSSYGSFEPGPIAWTATLNRPVSAHEVRENWIFPAPPATGLLELDGRRVVRWNDVVIDAGLRQATWLMDGPSFRAPIVIRIHPGDPDPHAGIIEGRIEIDTPRPTPENAVLFVLSFALLDAEMPEGQRRILGLPIVAAHRLGPADPSEQLNPLPTSAYRLAALERGADYLLVAIEDTNDDGYYTVGVDWWGYPRQNGTADVPRPVRALAPELDEGQIGRADFRIVRPGALTPEDF